MERRHIIAEQVDTYLRSRTTSEDISATKYYLLNSEMFHESWDLSSRAESEALHILKTSQASFDMQRFCAIVLQVPYGDRGRNSLLSSGLRAEANWLVQEARERRNPLQKLALRAHAISNRYLARRI